MFLLFARACSRWSKRPNTHSADLDLSGPVLVIFKLFFRGSKCGPANILFLSSSVKSQVSYFGSFQNVTLLDECFCPCGVKIMSISVVSIHQLVFLVMPWRKGSVGATSCLWPQPELYKAAYSLGMWINSNSGPARRAQRHGRHQSLVLFY